MKSPTVALIIETGTGQERASMLSETMKTAVGFEKDGTSSP